MRRATVAARILSHLSPPLPSHRPSLSHLPRHFRFAAHNPADTSSPPRSWKTSWKEWEEIYAIANNYTLAETPAVAQQWLVWHKSYQILTSYPFSLYSGRLFRSPGSRQFAADVEDLEDSADLGFEDFVQDVDPMDHKALNCAASACLGFALDYPNFLWSLSRKDVELIVENGSPFLFKDAADSAVRMKLYVDAATLDDLMGSEKPSTVDLMKFLLSYAAMPLFSPVVYKKLRDLYKKELVEESARRLFGEISQIVVPYKPIRLVRSPRKH